jgi:hypothetical protein
VRETVSATALSVASIVLISAVGIGGMLRSRSAYRETGS